MHRMVKSSLAIAVGVLVSLGVLLMVPSVWLPWVLQTFADGQGVEDFTLGGLTWSRQGLRADHLKFQRPYGDQMVRVEIISPAVAFSLRDSQPVLVRIDRLNVSTTGLKRPDLTGAEYTSSQGSLMVPPQLEVRVAEIHYARFEEDRPRTPPLRLNELELSLSPNRSTFRVTLLADNADTVAARGQLDLAQGAYVAGAEISLLWGDEPFFTARADAVSHSETAAQYAIDGALLLGAQNALPELRASLINQVSALEVMPDYPADLALDWQFTGTLDYQGVSPSPWRMALIHDLALQMSPSTDQHSVKGRFETRLDEDALHIKALTPIQVRSVVDLAQAPRAQVVVNLDAGATLLLAQERLQGLALAGDIQVNHPITSASVEFAFDRLAGDLGTMEGELQVNLLGRSPILGPLTADLNSQLRFGFGDQSYAKGRFQSSNFALEGNFNGQAILDSAAQWSLDLKSDELPTLLNAAHLLTDEIQDLALDVGGLRLRYGLSFTDNVADQVVDLDLLDVSGAYDGYPFEGLNLQAQLDPRAGWQSNGDIAVYIGRLDAVYPLFDVTAALKLLPDGAAEEKTLRVNLLSMNVLDGKIRSKAPFDLALESWQADVDLQVQELRLAQMLEAYGDGVIDAVGVIDGNLPVSIRGDDIFINDGWAKNKDLGGFIRYQMQDSGDTGDPQTDANLAFRLLEDFNYSDLGVKLTLTPDGDLAINLTLDGHNPAVLDGQRVVFNVNVDQNIYEMIQAWRMTEKYLKAAGQRLKMK